MTRVYARGVMSLFIDCILGKMDGDHYNSSCTSVGGNYFQLPGIELSYSYLWSVIKQLCFNCFGFISELSASMLRILATCSSGKPFHLKSWSVISSPKNSSTYIKGNGAFNWNSAHILLPYGSSVIISISFKPETALVTILHKEYSFDTPKKIY